MNQNKSINDWYENFGEQEHYQPVRPRIMTFADMRKRFVKTVYTILLIQLLVTSMFVCLSVFCDPFAQFQYETNYLFYLSICVIIIIPIILCCYPYYGTKKPINFILLSIFTLAMSWCVSYMCIFYQPNTILQAATTTAAATIGVTIYAWTTKNDYTELLHYVYGFIWSSVLIVIWIIIFSFAIVPGFYSIFSIMMALFACVYLLIDTQLIMGGRSFQVDMDNYVFGSFILYIDIIAIFVRLVRGFGWW